mgnify:CR=1 FL=1
MQRLIDTVAKGTVDRLFGLPRPAVERLFGPPPTNDRGAPLDHQVHVLLSIMDRIGQPELHEMELAEARNTYHHSTRIFDLAPRPMARVEDRTIPGPGGPIPMRLYWPERDSQMPALVFYHGGGFVVGTLDAYDGLCRALAERLGALVVSVDYRLAPEAPFPAAIDDSAAAFEWVVQRAEHLGVDPQRVHVGGDSAGGNISTVVTQQCVAAGGPTPAGQLLIYPKTDQADGYASRDHFAEGFFLSQGMADWFGAQYLDGAPINGHRHEDHRVSPIAFDALHDLPPTMVVTAGFDPLRDEGEAYAARLANAGVDVRHHQQDRLIHGFITQGGVIDAAGRAVADIAAEYRRGFLG